MINAFWFKHGLLAVIVQIIVAAPAALLGFPLWQAAALGGAFVIGCYVGRERHQAEIGAGSSTIPLWSWRGNPKAAKDIGVPAMLVSIVTAAAFLMEQAAG